MPSPRLRFLGLYDMHKKIVIKIFFFFIKGRRGKGGDGGWFLRVTTSLAFSSVGIDYPLLFFANTYERNDESYAAFAADDDELNSNPTLPSRRPTPLMLLK